MNVSTNTTWIPTYCKTCQISDGFSSTERRGIIVLVIFVSLALAGCFVGVLWYAIRTRTIIEPDQQLIMTEMQRNDAYNPDDETTSDLHQNSVPVTPRV